MGLPGMKSDFKTSFGIIRSKRRLLLFLFDSLIIVGIYFSMNILSGFRISSLLPQGAFSANKLVALFLSIMAVRLLLGIYTSIWRYADVTAFIHLMFADVVGGAIFFLVGRIDPNLNIGFGYTIIFALMIDYVTLLSRFAYQFLLAYLSQVSDARISKRIVGTGQGNQINIAIVGAGNVGATLAAELLRNRRAHYNPYCFIDVDPSKVGGRLNGIRVIKAGDDIADRLRELPVQEVVIAIPDASPEKRQELYKLYSKSGCKVKLYDYPLTEKAYAEKPGKKRALREFHIEDLLFRDMLEVNSEKSCGFYRGKTVLITGGGGSIGSELSRQVAKLQPKKLVLIDIYENNAYDIQQELLREYAHSLDLEVLIASVSDVKQMDEIFSAVRPDVVFHAAAHKHVPLMESCGMEAIKNNVFGTYNVANLAEKYGAEKFVLISTDKAVNPTNIMGATKRLCEMVIRCRKDSRTDFTAVRFGNVLGSNGSVIPLFRRQIESGGPVTLTDKKIIRYFMTIPEAVGLVMEAGAMAKNGELFVLDMGRPVRILDLAISMIRLSGLEPYKDIDIVEIGLRPGEKLYEELLMKSENLRKTDNDMIFIDQEEKLTREDVEQKLDILKLVLAEDRVSLDTEHDAVIRAIRATVPGYRDPSVANEKAEKSAEMRLVREKEVVV